MSLKHFGSKKLEEEREAISQILRSQGHAEVTIGLRSRAISIARVRLKLKDLKNIIHMKS